MRLDKLERQALRFALKDIAAEAYLFGSRLDGRKRGGDIDILLVPKKRVNSLKLSLKVQARFFSVCEEDIDVIVYKKGNLFCREILKNAQRIYPPGI